MFKNLSMYLSDPSALLIISTFITETMEVTDTAIQLSFSNYVVKFFTAPDKLLNTLSAASFANILLKTIVTSIQNNDSVTTTSNLNALADIATLFDKKPYGIALSDDLTKLVISLGAFSKSDRIKRYCIFICTCLVRISKGGNDLINGRIEILSTDSDYAIKVELAHQAKYILCQSFLTPERKDFYHDTVNT